MQSNRGELDARKYEAEEEGGGEPCIKKNETIRELISACDSSH